ncbi:hypothetical protein [Cellulomonas sp. S1-8]|uniref:hypothetical protein n=1 Tax=Cellulomonas sp. S1-8 TaxID=2904790 RepID=UPI002243164A|nr:hypothetical protein [Cellulomonas sp. S1-8]UZN03322.1 DUF1801 domain-containing protein [Cellulomonas sp. S1-8]
MTNRNPAVDAFLDELDHPLADDVRSLRLAILSLPVGVAEQVKWNAPSFTYGGVDRVTFNLRPTDRVQLILHRGVKVRQDAETFTFAADDLVEWITADRGTVTVAPADLAARRPALLDLVGRWVLA